MSLRLHGTTWLRLDRFSWNLLFEFFFRKSVQQIQVSLKSDHYTYMIIFRSFLLRMKNVSDKSCRENQHTYFVFSNLFFFSNRAVYEIMWRSIVERGRPQMTIWRTCIACWAPKTTKTHSEYVILIALPLQLMVTRTRISVTLYIHGLSPLLSRLPIDPLS